jgi:hypothetical protein
VAPCLAASRTSANMSSLPLSIGNQLQRLHSYRINGIKTFRTLGSDDASSVQEMGAWIS